jgi:hypothetical protein
MTCKETVARATDYCEEVLSSSEVEGIEAHLATCEKCRAYFEHAQLMITAMGRLPEPSTLSAETKEQLMVAFRERQSRGSPFRLKPLWGIAAAAVVCVVLSVGWWRWRSSQAVVITAHYHVVADLRNRMILRGGQGTEHGKAPLVFERGIDEVFIYLPEGSRVGTYEVAVFREELGKPLATATTTATMGKGMTALDATLDLSRVSSGHYLLGVRPTGVDWSYWSVVVK